MKAYAKTMFIIVGILFFVIGMGLLLYYGYIKIASPPDLYITENLTDTINENIYIKTESIIKNGHNSDFFMYNPSIYWKSPTEIGVISRISGHLMIPRLNKCINSIQKMNTIDYIDGLMEYIDMFGKNKNGCSGIVHYSLNIKTSQKDTPKIINPFFNINNIADDRYMGFEDPRVFTFMNKIWIITYFRGKNFPFPSTKKTEEMGHHVIIFPVDMSSNPVILDYKHANSVEKNWMPFEFKNELYIVYSVIPHIILHVDVNTGKCVQKYNTSYKNDKNYHIGNGAPPQLIAINDAIYFIGLGHTRGEYKGDITRKNFFYVFEATPPFLIKYMSIVFNIGKPSVHIEFGSGLLVDQQNKLIYVSYGEDDCYNSIVTLNLHYVLSLLGVSDR
jgi:hypothetical protein